MKNPSDSFYKNYYKESERNKSMSNLENELIKNKINIRIINTQNNIDDIKNNNNNINLNLTSAETWRKKNQEENILKSLNLKKTDISSEEFFMRKSTVNYIKKALSPVRPINQINNLSNSLSQSISSFKKLPIKINNNINLLKSDLILVNNLIKKTSGILKYFKIQFENENIKKIYSNLNLKENKNYNEYDKDKDKDKDNNNDTVNYNKEHNSLYFNDNNNNINKNNNLTLTSKKTQKNFNKILIQKKCIELDNQINENFIENLGKINDNSKNIDQLMNQYKCLTKDDLINKMAIENNTYYFLINKIDDLFFINNLKISNENNEFISSYFESYSKIQNIKSFIEYKENILNKDKDKININFNKNRNINNNNNTNKINKRKRSSNKSMTSLCCNHECKSQKEKEFEYNFQQEEKLIKKSNK
jgi:hypothetical protein